MNSIIEKNPNIGAFGCRTNRNGHTFQLVGNIDINNHDISYHRKIGSNAQKNIMMICFVFMVTKRQKKENIVQEIPINIFSGTLILLKKSAWKKMGKFQTEEFVHTDAGFGKSD